MASRLAGYNHNDSETIAYAGQYVDDSEPKRIMDKKGNKYIKNLNQIPTCQDISMDFLESDYPNLISAEICRALEYVVKDCKSMTPWTESLYDEVFKVWPIFHFLPGNFDKSISKVYMGPKKDDGNISIWEYDVEAEEQFKLMCLPNSILVKDMINDSCQNESMRTLEAIGLRMHVLADTWAHMFYAGIPAWFINFAKDFNPPAEGASPLKNAPFYNSYDYLGHSLGGHTPDYPYASYSFKPHWATEEIKKVNCEDFLKAFCQMVYALKCIKENKEFEIEKYDKLSENNERIIKKILITKNHDQSGTWKKFISEIKDKDDKSLEVPVDYNSDIWLNEYKKNPLDESSYYKFNKAAVDHLNFVLGELYINNVFLLDDFPRERILTFLIKHNGNGEYISKNSVWKGKNYPTRGKDGVEFEFILPNNKSGQLLSGTNVKIRTKERIGEKKYLGAWKMSTTLYYYTKDWDIFKQKWKIVQEGVPEGNPIDLNKPVLIINLHFKNKQYLAPYTHPLTQNKWLTTVNEKNTWFLEH